MPGPTAPRHWHDSRWWCTYFQRQQRTLMHQPWDDPTPLSAEERIRFAASLQEFQQAEGLEGQHFRRVVEEQAERTRDPEYAEAHRLFMTEEKRHAENLGAFLDREGIPRLGADSRRSWLFRAIAGRCGFEFTVAVVLHAEIIAQCYFTALRRATRSPLLQGISTQIVRDETMHIRLHCERLASLRRNRGRLLLMLTNLLDLVLFCGAWLVCLWGHRSVLRAGGWTWCAYWNEARRCGRRAAGIKNPRAYRWPTAPASVHHPRRGSETTARAVGDEQQTSVTGLLR